MRVRNIIGTACFALSLILHTGRATAQSAVGASPLSAGSPSAGTATAEEYPASVAWILEGFPSFASNRGAEVLGSLVATGKGAGPRVVKAAMDRLAAGTILQGACWDFINAIYDDAGYPIAKRKRIFTGAMAGPWADPSLIEAGDWIYYVHQYSASLEHSCVFVAWLDFSGHTALVIDYPGGNRSEPGRWRVADLYKIFGITRAVE